MMRNWKTKIQFLGLSAFIFAGSVSSSVAQTPGNLIQQPSQQPQQQAQLQAQQQAPAGAAAPNPQQAMQPGGMGQVPFPPLEPAHQQYLERVLVAWENSTSGIERYQCKFARWEFDPTKNNDPRIFQSVATGVIRYLAPDKGMFQVEDIKFLKQKPDGKWAHEAIPDQFGEWWICDGTSVHLYDQTKKHVKKYPLPPNMQGAEVFNSPLPFVFGVKAQKIQERFWIRPLEPPTLPNGKPSQDVVVLEAYPKYQGDAVNYHHVTIELDVKTVLPTAIAVHLPNWTPQAPHREIFQFQEREVNGSLLAKINETVFRQSFIPKEPPKGWTVEEIPFVPEEDAQRVATPGGQQQNSLPR
ncbi:MAG: TIGR03009 domain-containing protein [Pirellulaceae bacterium]|nr:TIGR03009 domain-containing protein [Pirellulaceae bacterium]